ncbi:hypothetical protein [Methanopyrus kandleri]
MGDPWEELERFSDPELLEFSKRLDVELSEKQLKKVDSEISMYEYQRVKYIIGIPIFTLIGLSINGMMPFILIDIYPKYPAYASTHAAAVLAWDTATLIIIRSELSKRAMQILKLISYIKKPVLCYYFSYRIVAPAACGFILLIFTSLKPLYILYKNPKAAIASVIAYHVLIFTPLISYLVIRLAKTPVVIPYVGTFSLYYRVPHAVRKL